MLDEARLSTQWPKGVQPFTLALTQVKSLLNDPHLSMHIAKTLLLPADREMLGEYETYDHFKNVINIVVESILPCYLARDRERELRQHYGVLDTHPYRREIEAKDSAGRGGDNNERGPGVSRQAPI